MLSNIFMSSRPNLRNFGHAQTPVIILSNED